MLQGVRCDESHDHLDRVPSPERMDTYWNDESDHSTLLRSLHAHQLVIGATVKCPSVRRIVETYSKNIGLIIAWKELEACVMSGYLQNGRLKLAYGNISFPRFFPGQKRVGIFCISLITFFHLSSTCSVVEYVPRVPCLHVRRPLQMKPPVLLQNL